MESQILLITGGTEEERESVISALCETFDCMLQAGRQAGCPYFQFVECATGDYVLTILRQRDRNRYYYVVIAGQTPDITTDELTGIINQGYPEIMVSTPPDIRLRAQFPGT